ncbi:core protein [Grass carp reovirus]|uniref:Core protein n=1 Tax=Grass carp reovirus TaxID=128987 RepID=M1U1T8_GCRV|nr:core protein [Grass carp reovirus]AJQ21756.1 VP6 [Grass carp reovirus]
MERSTYNICTPGFFGANVPPFKTIDIQRSTTGGNTLWNARGHDAFRTHPKVVSHEKDFPLIYTEQFTFNLLIGAFLQQPLLQNSIDRQWRGMIWTSDRLSSLRIAPPNSRAADLPRAYRTLDLANYPLWGTAPAALQTLWMDSCLMTLESLSARGPFLYLRHPQARPDGNVLRALQQHISKPMEAIVSEAYQSIAMGPLTLQDGYYRALSVITLIYLASLTGRLGPDRTYYGFYVQFPKKRKFEDLGYFAYNADGRNVAVLQSINAYIYCASPDWQYSCALYYLHVLSALSLSWTDPVGMINGFSCVNQFTDVPGWSTTNRALHTHSFNWFNLLEDAIDTLVARRYWTNAEGQAIRQEWTAARDRWRMIMDATRDEDDLVVFRTPDDCRRRLKPYGDNNWTRAYDTADVVRVLDRLFP